MMLSIGTGLTFVKNYVAAVFGGNTSYNPVHVFGSDLVTWYGNSVEELWAEHRACWEDSPELVVNGDFSDGVNGWAYAGAGAFSVSANAGVLTLPAVVANRNDRQIHTTLADLTPGRSYRVSVRVVSASSVTLITAGFSGNLADSDTTPAFAQATGPGTIVFTGQATAATMFLRLMATTYSGGGSFSVTDISVREVDFSKPRLFSDNLGTTPITGLEQTVGVILDKSKGLELGPEKFSGFATLGPGWVVEADGSWSCVNTSGSNSDARVDLPNTPGVWNRVAFTLLENTLTSNGCFPMSTSPFSLGAIPGDRVVISNPLSDTVTSRFVIFRAAPGSTLRISNISVRELPGHHLSQSTATSRGRLSARYNEAGQNVNLMTTPWTLDRAVRTVSLDQPPPGYGQAIKLAADTENAVHFLRNVTGPAGRYFGVLAKAAEYPFVEIRPAGLGVNGVRWDLASGVPVLVGPNVAAHGIESVGDGWYWCWMELIPSVTSSSDFRIHLSPENSSASYAGDNTSGILIASPDRRGTRYPFVPLHQRVNSASDYDTVGFPARLVMDGVDDSWLTGAIDLTATDKVTVLTTVKKRSDAAQGVVFEFGAGAQNGSFNITASASAGPNFQTFIRGTANSFATSPAGYPAPTVRVIGALGDISAPSAILRIDGAQVTASSAGLGTGNYGNYPLHVGRRNNISTPFNGDIFSLPMVVRRLATPEEITAAESAFGRTIGVLQ
jgi:hypothetical protein